MTKYICDRCNKEFSAKLDYVKSIHTRTPVVNSDMIKSCSLEVKLEGYFKDLCEDCQNKLVLEGLRAFNTSLKEG